MAKPSTEEVLREQLEQQIAHRRKVQEVVRTLLRRSMRFRDALIQIRASGDPASSSLAYRALLPDLAPRNQPSGESEWGQGEAERE